MIGKVSYRGPKNKNNLSSDFHIYEQLKHDNVQVWATPDILKRL